jgi:hypothetical protein
MLLFSGQWPGVTGQYPIVTVAGSIEGFATEDWPVNKSYRIIVPSNFPAKFWDALCDLSDPELDPWTVASLSEAARSETET